MCLRAASTLTKPHDKGHGHLQSHLTLESSRPLLSIYILPLSRYCLSDHHEPNVTYKQTRVYILNPIWPNSSFQEIQIHSAG